MRSASSTAMKMASAYSRTSDLWRTGAAASRGAGASGRVSVLFIGRSALEDRQECLLRHLDLADLLHAFLALLLLLEQLALARDVAAVALGGDVLAHGLDGLARDDPAPDGRLDGDLVELPRDDAAELLGQRLALLVGLVAVGDDAQRVYGVAVEQDVELDHVRLAKLEEVVVEGCVALRDGLELVVEVDHDLGEREVELDVAALAQVLERLVLAPLLLRQLVDLAHELRRQEDGAAHVGLLDALDLVHRRQLGRVVDLDGLALHRHHAEAHARGRDDQREVELALEPLLDDLEVEHAEEAAAEAVAERERGLGLEVEGGVVEAELLEGVPQPLVVGVLDRVEAGEDHGLSIPVARTRLGGRLRYVRDRLAHLGVGHALDGRGEIADLAGAELVHRAHVGGEDAALLDLADLAVGHEQDAHPRAHAPVDQADVDDDALVRVVEGVEDESLERRLRVSLGRRNAADDGFEHLGHSRAVLGRDRERRVAVEPEDLGDLRLRAFHVGRGQVDLVDDRDDFEPAVRREVEVGEGLGLDALARVHDQDGALARRERARDLIGEVHVPGRVDQVERVFVAVARRVEEAHGVGLDGDAALLLEVHGVEDLAHGLLGVHRAGEREQAVRQGGLAVVDVGDDGEVTDAGGGHRSQDITR